MTRNTAAEIIKKSPAVLVKKALKHRNEKTKILKNPVPCR
jgi:hypothetical protein